MRTGSAQTRSPVPPPANATPGPNDGMGMSRAKAGIPLCHHGIPSRSRHMGWASLLPCRQCTPRAGYPSPVQTYPTVGPGAALSRLMSRLWLRGDLPLMSIFEFHSSRIVALAVLIATLMKVHQDCHDFAGGPDRRPVAAPACLTSSCRRCHFSLNGGQKSSPSQKKARRRIRGTADAQGYSPCASAVPLSIHNSRYVGGKVHCIQGG